jgi:SAM-dependent methyltransferase
MENVTSGNDAAEKKVADFYNNQGWITRDGITEDAKRFEDLRSCAAGYISKCRLRTLRHIPLSGESIIDMASGPIQYPEYLTFSSGFKKRYCVDLSQDALDKAKELIGTHGKFLHGSFFDLNFEDDFFDCAISLHTIYHMDKNKQEDAVRKLIKIVKKDKPIIIIYSNPNAFYSSPKSPLRRFVKVIKQIRVFSFKEKVTPPIIPQQEADLYFYRHELSWWKRFEDVSMVKILPWRTFEVEMQTRLFPDNFIGKLMFKFLFFAEEMFPTYFTKVGVYPMIVITKKC